MHGIEEKRCAGLESARDRWDQHDLVAILKGIRFAAQEADVFVVDVDVDEAPQLALLILDLGGERGEVRVYVGNQRGQIGRFRGELFLPVGVADEGGRENDLD